MITLGKGGTLSDRRLASARLHQDEEAVKILFNDIAPTQKERRGGYTRIVRLGQRVGDAAQLAILEFVDVPVLETPAEPEKAGAAEKASKEPAKPEEAKKEKEAGAVPA
jgi:large subunit ribosomal protein L17